MILGISWDLPAYMFDFRVQMDMELSDKCPAFMSRIKGVLIINY